MMYQIMIVDDEPIVCEGLKMFSWEIFGCQIVAEALDGIEALALASSIHPDVIISDIKMPGIDGIEFTKKIKEQYPNTEIVLLTGYADFSYAQQALKLGVCDYLLKPFSFDDIEKSLKKCIASLQEKQIAAQLNSVVPLFTQQIFQELLDGKISSTSDPIMLCNIKPSKYIVLSIQRDMENHGINDQTLCNLLRKSVEGMEREFYLAQGTDIINCVLCFKAEKSNELCNQATLNFCQLFQKSVEEQVGFPISIGVSLPSDDIFVLKQLKDQSIYALNYRYSFGGSFALFYSDIQQESSSKAINLSTYQNNLQKCLLLNNQCELEKQFKKLIDSLTLASNGDFIFVKKNLMDTIIQMFHFAEHAVPRFNRKIPYQEFEMLIKYQTLESFSLHALSLIKEIVTVESTSLNDCIIDKVLAYIQENLDKDLSLDLLCKHLNYSTAYLSRLIKKHSGKNFMELLLDCRINRAKEFLKNTDLKISQIALQIGYNDYSYFIQMFKKKCGVTPNEYRALYSLKKNWR